MSSWHVTAYQCSAHKPSPSAEDRYKAGRAQKQNKQKKGVSNVQKNENGECWEGFAWCVGKVGVQIVRRFFFLRLIRLNG